MLFGLHEITSGNAVAQFSMYNTLFYLSFCLLFFSVSLPSPHISFPNDLLTELSTFILLICIVQSGKYKHFYFWDVFMMSRKNFLILASSFFSFFIFSGVCATLTVLKPTSILFALPMGNLMIMHVKSKRHHARNRRKLKSCLWVDVKVTLITKLISKNVFNFCSGKKKEPGLASYLALLTFPLDSCNL